MLPIVLLITSCVLLPQCRAYLETQWTNYRVLDGKGLYHLYWTVRNGLITFKVEVASKGYVGFGFSPNGGMAGSDVVTGWIENGKPYFQDRHCDGNWIPEIDYSQDWELLQGGENDTHTILIFSRKLETCDREDREIDISAMRVIYSFSDEDPKSEEQLMYHKLNRGTKTIMFLQPDLKIDIPKEGVKTWEILSPNHTIVSKVSTMYWCKLIRGLSLETKHHIIKAEPILQKRNQHHVHHVMLFECYGKPEDYEPYIGLEGDQCYHPYMPLEMAKCDTYFVIFSAGTMPLVMDGHVGLPIEPRLSKYYRLEVHYENLPYNKGLTDQSGIRIYYTPNLRKYDASVFSIGSTGGPFIIVPPRQESFVIAGHSSPKCMGPEMPADGLNMMGVLLHGHMLGQSLKARHFRGKKELPTLGVDNSYDFRFQNFHFFPEERKLLPDDQLTVECTYNSSRYNKTVFGGPSVKDEMCLGFIMYYPRINRLQSLSAPPVSVYMELTGVQEQISGVIKSPPELANHRLSTHLREFDWRNSDVRFVEQKFRYSPHTALCITGEGKAEFLKDTISYPKEFEPYQKPSVCDNLMEKEKIEMIIINEIVLKSGGKVRHTSSPSLIFLVLSSCFAFILKFYY